jgi:hypothetical protein
MNYSERYKSISNKHLGKTELLRSWALEGEVLDLLFEINYLQAEVNFLKGGNHAI